ncbi:MAG TPA: hypothetical protein VKS80_00670 [Trinickia sp.]|nr:hypothetical protein [Trinickia sp.]
MLSKFGKLDELDESLMKEPPQVLLATHFARRIAARPPPVARELRKICQTASCYVACTNPDTNGIR